MNVDLSFTPEDAAKQIGREVDGAIDRLRRLGAEMVEQLQSIASFKAADLVAINQAERAIVFDFEFGHTDIRRIGLTFDFGQGCPAVELSPPLEKGAYRAVVLVTKRK